MSESKRRRQGVLSFGHAGAFRAGAQNVSCSLVAKRGCCRETGEVLLLKTPPRFQGGPRFVCFGFPSLCSRCSPSPCRLVSRSLKPAKCHCRQPAVKASQVDGSRVSLDLGGMATLTVLLRAHSARWTALLTFSLIQMSVK